MSDHEHIYLAPICHQGGDGRTWSFDMPWGSDCGCDFHNHKPVKYIRNDIHARLTAELRAARARVAVLEEALEMALIGGNHIACVLIGKLGPGFANLYPPDMPHAEVLEVLGAGDDYETWCCWRALMNARAAALRARPPLRQETASERPASFV